jgi:hypothetical protein
VFCIVHIANRGAGLPDGGFFSASQKRTADKADEKVKENPLLAMLPERGVLEVKGADADLETLKNSEQVKKYLDKYGQVLITNLRQFALVERDEKGELADVESFSLADSAAAFWKMNPQYAAEDKGEEFEEFLKRCLLSGAPLASPQDVAAFLASYAREARLRLEKTELAKLLPLKTALESALGIKFESPDSKLSEADQKKRGERFFRATLVQTLFYGLFSAWLSHVEENPDEPFDWQKAQWSLHVPMVSVIFEQLMQPSSLKSLELRELIELAARTLNRVQTKAFFEKWEGALAVQYFYEPFLEKFDPVLRKELGVYYTPPEIVQYMVERVHRVLQSELKRPLGLADPDVVILDPCCGTGAFVVETLRKIAATLESNGAGALLGHDLKTAATSRVYAFEILPAPFVVAHHGVNRMLKEFGVILSEDERAKIYLTNALTGWTEEPKTEVLFEAFKQEREAAQQVKRQEKILVIIGNPPYDAFAKIDEDHDLAKPYKQGLQSEWGIKKFNLDDLYVRFFRVAERRLTQNSEGVLCFISNFSYLREPSFVVMRQRLLQGFDSMWIDVLNGDSRETGKRTPEGLPDPSVFSTTFNREGIRVGTAINLMVRKSSSLALYSIRREKTIRSRNLWGTRKREELLESLTTADFEAVYEVAQPKKESRFSLRPQDVSADYSSWPLLTELCAIAPFQGLAEDRRKALIDESRSELIERMKDYFDSDKSWDELVSQNGPLIHSYVDFPAKEVRERVLKTEQFSEMGILPYTMRAFDNQFCYYTSFRPIWRRPRPEYFKQAWSGNSFLLSRFKAHNNPKNTPMYFSQGLCDYHCIAPNVGAFALFIRREIATDLEPDENGVMQVKSRTETMANLSGKARAYLNELGFAAPDEDNEVAALIWRHALAIGYAPQYRAEHADGLASDWPRVPLPADSELLRASATLGAQVAALLDVAKPFPGINSGALRPELLPLGALQRVDGKGLQPDKGDLKIEVNWGFHDHKKSVMAGQGKVVERTPDAKERAALDSLGLNEELVCDIYLNERVYWSAVPKGAWQFIIGGYQVMKKWLSYRDFKVLGRDLMVPEAREVEAMARRLTLLCALESQLNANYQQCAANSYPWNEAIEDANSEGTETAPL